MARYEKQVGAAANITQRDRNAYRDGFALVRRSAPQKVRQFFLDLGYRQSSAAPGPKFGFCHVHDDYGYGVKDQHYFSRVFIDRDPEAEIPGVLRNGHDYQPRTTAGQRVLAAMGQWVTARYKPTNRALSQCYFFNSATDAKVGLNNEFSRFDGVNDIVVDTGIK